jgi:hypothetical protein
VVRGDVAYPNVATGALLTGTVEARLQREWDRAAAASFMPQF